jgi:WD40 repeat protein
MHDMVVNVWNLKTKFKVASNKIACKVKGIAFSRDGAYFVTVGNRHVKFWYLTVSSLMETVPLKGRAAILGDMKNNYFCDVACGGDECSHMTYTITTNGILCEFNENRSLSRATELRAERAYCIYSDNCNLFVGCSNGAVHIFRQKNLDFIASLPRPHYLGVDIAKGLDTRHLAEGLNNPDAKYPDCVALCYDQYDCILSAIYNDHSFYVWDIKDFAKVKKLDSHLFHSSCCWALDLYSAGNASMTSNLPVDSFVTCSTDNTLRVWSTVSASASSNSANSSGYKLKRNIYSKELLKVIYIDNDLSGLCEIDQSIAGSSDSADSASSSSAQPAAKNVDTNAITNLPVSTITNFSSNETSTGNSLKMGARCIKINPFGTHMATGDRNGNIRIYDLNTLESICMIEAHDGEVLYLQYSQPESGKHLLASSSRDRLIHIFDAGKSTYDLLQTLDDHSAAITAVRFCFNQQEKQLYVISCGADKSIMFRTATQSSESSSPSFNAGNSQQLQFVRTSYVAEKQTFYDLNLDTSRNCINTISQDRMIRTYSIKDGKKVRQFKGSLNEDGYLLKMDTDRSGSLLATSCTDKCVYVWDLNSSECVAYLYGHSEVVTDLKFTSDNQHLITVSGDGCIFVWKLNNLPTHANVNVSSSNQAWVIIFFAKFLLNFIKSP